MVLSLRRSQIESGSHLFLGWAALLCKCLRKYFVDQVGWNNDRKATLFQPSSKSIKSKAARSRRLWGSWHVVLFSTSSYGLQRPKSRSLGRKKAGPNEGRRAEHDDRYWCKAICKRAFKTGMIHLEIYSLNGPPPLSSLQLSSIFIMIITKRFYQEVLDSLKGLS